jgi:hypothetical protein
MLLPEPFQELSLSNFGSDRNFRGFGASEAVLITGGEGGIRTPGTGLSQYDGLANRCFRPLSHLSGF